MCTARRRRTHGPLRIIALLSPLLIASELRAQSAALRGRILDEQGERPIANALIEIRDVKRSAHSDSSGAFRITGVTAGVHHIIVRVLGYDSVASAVRFVDRDSVDADILMRKTSTRLATVRTEASAGPMNVWKLQEFNERRRIGLGKFLDAAVFEKNAGRRVSEIVVSSIPGVRSDEVGRLQGQRSGRWGCVLQIILNGVFATETNVNRINAEDIIGFEYYTVASTPLKYNATGDKAGGAQCGTAVIWTK